MPKYKDVIDLYDDRGKRIAKQIPLEAISPLRNNAIKRIASMTERTIAVNLAGIEKALKTGAMGGDGAVIKGKEIDIPLVKSAEKIAKAIKEMVQVVDGDETLVQVKSEGKSIVVVVPEARMRAGVEYTTGFTAVAAATYTQALADAGADVIQMSEPSASTDLLSPDMFTEYSGSYVKSSLACVNGADSVLHICGDTLPILDLMCDTGVTGLSIEEKVDSVEAVKHVNGRAALVGNVGVVFPLLQGTPADCEAAGKRIAAAGFNIVSPGCGLSALIPGDNLKALVKGVKG